MRRCSLPITITTTAILLSSSSSSSPYQQTVGFYIIYACSALGYDAPINTANRVPTPLCYSITPFPCASSSTFTLLYRTSRLNAGIQLQECRSQLLKLIRTNVHCLSPPIGAVGRWQREPKCFVNNGALTLILYKVESPFLHLSSQDCGREQNKCQCENQ